MTGLHGAKVKARPEPHASNLVPISNTIYGPDQTEPAAKLRVLLAVLTTGARNGPLRACVQAIARLRPAFEVELELLLVQNGSGTITPELEALRNEAIVPFDVAVEPRRGIPVARNRAIVEAEARSFDYLAFIDDDAAPDNDWLVEAMEVLRATGAQAVTGPQLPVFPDHAPRRLVNAAIYQAAEHDVDRPCTWAASNNVIFSIRFAVDHGLSFNETFTTGGSDKEYFKRFVRAGGIIRWAPRAIVREPVVPERLNVNWAIRRSWRLGTSGFRIEASVRPPRQAVAICLGKGACYLAGGIGLLPLAIVPKHAGYVNGLCYLAHGAGFVLGLTSRFRPRSYV